MKLLNKFLSFIVIFVLLFAQVSTPLAVLAQEATPSAEPSPSPSPTPSLDESLTALQATDSAVIDTALAPSVWQTNADGSMTTTNPVSLNTTYKAPQNDKVTVNFNKLPDPAGKLTIKEIKLTQEQIQETGALSDTAYDLSSSMQDGTFEYTLTLPTSTTENVEVKASEDGQTFVTLGGVSASGDVLTITGLTHFTIFVVVGTINSDNTVDEFNESGASVLINEFVYDTTAPQDAGEWVELYNQGASEVDLTDWRLEDGNNINDDIDLSGIIPAGGILVFENNAWLNNTGDTINLLDNNSDLVSQVSYKSSGSIVVGAQDVGNVTAGQSVGRVDDGGDNWDSFSTPTKGASNRSNVYVDVNAGGNFYGTFNNPFTTIQEGIDALAEGGTVNVAGGEYEEGLTIGQPLTLLGDPGNEDAGPGENAPTIFGDCSGDPVASVEANNVTVSGFIIVEDGCDGSNIYIDGSTSGATISDNDINEASYYGVELGSGSSDNQILRNLIHDNGDYGIYNNGSTNTTITNNDIYYNNGGIGMGGSGDISGTQITNNNIHENYNTGIYSGGNVTFSELNIQGNQITNNDGYGIYFDQVISTPDTLTISDNTITGNSGNGIYIDYILDSTVEISGNTVNGNGTSYGYAGIYINNITGSTLNLVNNPSISGNFGNGVVLCGDGYCSDSTLTVSGNNISANDGVGLQVYSIGATTLTVEENTISENGSTGFELSYVGIGGPTPSSVTFGGNSVEGNDGYGIYLTEVDSVSSVFIGSGNTISNNTSAGIFLYGGVTNTLIEGNTIQNNGGDIGLTGIVVNSASGNEAHNNIISGNNVGVNNQDEDGDVFDARENWWGSILGPLHELLNPGGEGNSISDNVLFRPFFLDELLETLSTNEVDPENLASLLNTGSFSIPEGEDSEAASQLNVNEDVVINVNEDGGTSTVSLPSGVIITNPDGTIDVSDLTASDSDPNTLSGLASGTVVDGALQWGLPDIELNFNPAITISIFVGTSFDNQTLDIVRSTSGSDDWISDGIVAPATCVVTAGICRFQATKASFYAATHTSVSSSTSSSSSTTQSLSQASGSAPAPTCSDTKPGSAPTLVSALTGANSVTLNWNKALDPVTYYLATYGLTSGTQQYGNPNIGGKETTSYNVEGLSGGTTYYFKVRAGNGCAPGDFSNELSATPTGGFVSGPAAGFAPGVLGVTTDQDVGLGEVQGEVTPSATQPSITASPQEEAGQSPFPVRTVVVIVIVLLLGFGVFKLVVK